jgi:integrase/recombinase XerD
VAVIHKVVGATGVSEANLRDRALVAFLVSTGCRISEAPQLDRNDWASERVVVRCKGDIERAAVITEHARLEVERYLAVRGDDTAPLFLSYSRARKGQRLTVRGAGDVCARLGITHRVTKLHQIGSGTPPGQSCRRSSGIRG